MYLEKSYSLGMNNVVFSVLYYFFYFRRTVIASGLRISNDMITISAIHIPSTGRKPEITVF